MIRGAGRLKRMDGRHLFENDRNTLDPSYQGGDLPSAGRVIAEEHDGVIAYVGGDGFVVNPVEFLACLSLEEAIATIKKYPKSWAPRNQHYVKTHVSAPGTVRAWFRQMRAADVERAMHVEWAFDGLPPVVRRPWTVFDTQRVVDRETAAHYDEYLALFGLPIITADWMLRNRIFTSTVPPAKGVVTLEMLMAATRLRFGL